MHWNWLHGLLVSRHHAELLYGDVAWRPNEKKQILTPSLFSHETSLNGKRMRVQWDSVQSIKADNIIRFYKGRGKKKPNPPSTHISRTQSQRLSIWKRVENDHLEAPWICNEGISGSRTRNHISIFLPLSLQEWCHINYSNHSYCL